jgi:2-keto-3-deoxy-L-rhamnonate aldolase RhmA
MNMLGLMYLTNQVNIARLAQSAGVDRIFVDMEYIGKAERQGGMDTVQNRHTADDVKKLRQVLDRSELLVRVNPIHGGSKDEIDGVISAGADIVMLPMWTGAEEVERFISLVGGRARTMLLLETQGACDCIDEVLELDGVDEIHIGLNDLCISQGKRFLFEPVADGTVDALAKKLKAAEMPFGFGGIGRLGEGLLRAELILAEHIRLGSQFAILSRSFCNTQLVTDEEEISRIFTQGVKEIRAYEDLLGTKDAEFFESSHSELCRRVKEITEATDV